MSHLKVKKGKKGFFIFDKNKKKAVTKPDTDEKDVKKKAIVKDEKEDKEMKKNPFKK